MRVLSIAHNPVYGGFNAQILHLRSHLERRGIQSLLLTTDEQVNVADRMRAGGVDVFTQPLHRLRATPNPLVQARFLATAAPEVAAIRRLIRECGADLVQVQNPTNPHGALAARLEGVGVVWQISDTVLPPRMRRVLMPMVVRLSDSIVTWGRRLAFQYPGAASLGERCVTIYPAVPAEDFRYDRARREAARGALGVSADALAVGAVGNRNPAKGHDLLIDAALRIAGRRPEAVFRVIGAPSPAHAEWERQLQERASGLGERLRFVDPGSRVADLVGGLDVFTMTSPPRSEGAPTAILEAMIAGLPVVTTDVGACRELVEDGVTGFVVPPRDPGALASAWERLAADRELRRRMGEAGASRAARDFGIDSVADRHERAYRLAAEHAAGSRRTRQRAAAARA
jgi:glycosyltransferase involved in cell wall biosynthesis